MGDDRSSVIVELLRGQGRHLERIDKSLSNLEIEQGKLRESLARYEGGFKGIMLIAAGLAASLGLWVKYRG